MNIWIFNHYAITPDLPGGTRHFDLGKELVKLGYNVVIFASSFHHSKHQEMKLAMGKLWKVEEVDGVKFIWLRTFPYRRNDWRRVVNMVSYMLRAWWLGRTLPRLAPETGNPDVVIGSSVHLLAVLAAYWVAKHHKARFVMEVRDLWPQTIVDMGELSERSPITKALQALERSLYGRAGRIITLLPLAHEYFVSCGVPREKIVWIPNGVDLRRFSNVENGEPLHRGFNVIYLGAHSPIKALDTLLKAAEIIQSQGSDVIRFILIGDGSEKPRLIELAKELKLKNVEFRDPVQKAEIPKPLYEADVTVLFLNDLPIYRYGISMNKLFDYLAAKKPLILAGNPVNNPVEETHCGLTVPPRNPQALAEAVIKLYQMPQEERKAMGRRGREYVEKHHNISILVERLIQCIEEVGKQ